MISLFPYDETDTTGITNGLTIDMYFYSVSWRPVASFFAPE